MGFFSYLRPDGPGNPEQARLPANRFKAYFDIVRNRFFLLVGLSLLTFLFFVPLYAWRIAWGAYMGGDPAGELTALELLYREFILRSAGSLVEWPLQLLACFGLGGAFEVASRLCHQEGSVFLVKDFGKGLKENWKSSLLAGALIGFGNFLFNLNSHFYPLLEWMPNWASVVITIFFALIMALFQMWAYFLLASSTVYRFRFKDSTKNTFLFSFILYPKNLLFLLLSALFPLLLELIPYLLVQEILIGLIAFYGLAHLALVFELYGLHVFDRYINPTYSPQEVGRGLNKEQMPGKENNNG